MLIPFTNNPQYRTWYTPEPKPNPEGTHHDCHVSVESGTVMVQCAGGEWVTLTAGEEKTFEDVVRRSHWVYPVDGQSAVHHNRGQWIYWLDYPNAFGFALELNIPPPVFSSNNTKTFEFTRQVAYFNEGDPNFMCYPDVNGYGSLIAYFVPEVPGCQGLLMEARIYALDEHNGIIQDSVSSDKYTWICD